MRFVSPLYADYDERIDVHDVMFWLEEGGGIDVYATVRNAGYELKVATSYNQRPTYFGLLLLT